jgi:MFS family permease
VVNLLCTVIALAVIDRIGRKALLMFASAGMGVSLTLLGVLLSMPGMASGLILTLVLCYVGCFSVGLGPGVWVVISELFPTRVRGRAMSVATISLWMACLAITSSFLSVVRAISIVGAFGTYAALCLLTFLFVWRCVPETKGRSLEEIERQWTK